ncbi:MAG: outer membrane beta-barrel protein [Bacteroidales bacterium]|nr:outer membrane beta-barrel protein [Bacteroidales bacterium]
MKRGINLLIIILVSIQAFSQKSEYQYFAVRFGATHGFSAQPLFNANKYINTPDGEMQAIPADAFLGYTPGFVADIYYHFDFPTDNAGIFTGLEYNYYGMSSKYQTKYGDYTAIEKNMVNSVGIPIAIKFWPDLYKDQKYIYLGAKYSFNLTMTSVQKVSWTNAKAREKIDAEQFSRSNFGMFFGINYLAFNLQFDYVPGTLFNSEYKSPLGFLPYEGQPDKMFFITTAINVPVNGWIGKKSYGLKKFFNKLRFWK